MNDGLTFFVAHELGLFWLTQCGGREPQSKEEGERERDRDYWRSAVRKEGGLTA